MDDLISRQAAIDVADAVWSVTGDKNVAKVWDQIKDLPSAQPDIVRCKECRYNHDCDIQYHAQAGEEFYCGAAERRTDE